MRAHRTATLVQGQQVRGAIPTVFQAVRQLPHHVDAESSERPLFHWQVEVRRGKLQGIERWSRVPHFDDKVVVDNPDPNRNRLGRFGLAAVSYDIGHVLLESQLELADGLSGQVAGPAVLIDRVVEEPQILQTMANDQTEWLGGVRHNIGLGQPIGAVTVLTAPAGV